MAGFKHKTIIFEDDDLKAVNNRLNVWLGDNQNNIEVISSNLTTYNQPGMQRLVFVIHLIFVKFNLEDEPV